MRYETLFDLFKDQINKPHDLTDCFWYKWDCCLSYSSSDETNPNPEMWEDIYTSDGAGCYTEKGDYAIVTLDDGCGGEYQAFFKLSMQVDPEGYE